MNETSDQSQAWAAARRAAERRAWLGIVLLAAAMTAAVVAEFVRGHTIDALVFSVVGASGIAAVAAVLTRGSGWVRNHGISDYRRATIGLVAFAVLCWVPAVVFVGRSTIAVSVFTCLGLMALFFASGTWLTASILRRAAEAVGVGQVIAICSGGRVDRRSMVLVLTAVKVFAFTKVRVRGPLVPDPGASLEVEHIERAEIRVEGTAVGVSIRTGERELAFKASPVQGREFVAAVQAARAPLDAR